MKLRKKNESFLIMGSMGSNMFKTSQPQSQCESDCTQSKMRNEFTPVYQFKFLEPFEENSTNGLCFNDIYLPEEVIDNILNHVPLKDLLGLTLVCKKWCNIIKSESFWMGIYNRRRPDKAKKLPWYVFYSYFTTNNFHNLLRNGNGQERYKHWKIVQELGNKFKIENPPSGSEPLPVDIADFNGSTSCFATSYQNCSKIQEISLRNKRLLRYILNKFMPHIYVSEWVAGRFDCGCRYQLGIRGYGEEYTDDTSLDVIADNPEGSAPIPLFYMTKKIVIEQWEGKKWEKVDILVEEYPHDVVTLVFQHQGCDTQFWRGHYGSKMAGGVVRILFESIQPLGERDETEARNLYQNIDM